VPKPPFQAEIVPLRLAKIKFALALFAGITKSEVELDPNSEFDR
jgi:hypothetical protein